MPRRYSWSWGEDRAWDNYYNQCWCEWNQDDPEEEPYEVECDYCKRQRARAAAREAERQAAAAAEEARLRATGWYEEIISIRSFINRISWLAGPGNFDARVKVFTEMFAALLTYEKFLAAHPKMRAVIASKITECRANEQAPDTLKGAMDQLEALFARLPTVEGYKE